MERAAFSTRSCSDSSPRASTRGGSRACRTLCRRGRVALWSRFELLWQVFFVDTLIVVQVTLRNEGEEGYKTEFFGDKITFKRTISDKGASAVSIVGESSRAVSGRAAREEAARIQKAFNISVDNPIVILQQEQAKELLRMESPEKLYNFFVVRILLSSDGKIFSE